MLSDSLSINTSQILIYPCLRAFRSLHYHLSLKSSLLLNASVGLFSLSPLLYPASMFLKSNLIHDIKSKFSLSVSTALFSELLLNFTLTLVFLFTLLLLYFLFKATEINVLSPALTLSLDFFLVFKLNLLIN